MALANYNDNVNSPMMWPRLRLLHELLGEAESIWITLDDNEIHRARTMLDAIFGHALY